MTTFHLAPRGDRWELTEQGRHPVGSFPTKARALERAVAIVSEVTGTLKIHRADGTIEEERAFPPAAKDSVTS
jgi:hypothetical protein